MKKKFSTDHLPFSALAFDPAYQRELLPARVRALREKWDLNEVGAITVSIRTSEPRTAYVIDGQHRVRAAMELGLGATKVLCHVYRGLTLDEEARKFLAANDSRPVTPFDKYKAGLVANDPVALGVRDTAAEHGWTVAGSTSDGRVSCVAELTNIYTRDADSLDGVLSVLTEAWGTRAVAVDRSLVSGMATVLGRYNGEVDRGALARKIGKYRGGPGALLGDARGLADIKKIGVGRACAEQFVTVYNRGRRSGQLLPL